MNKELRKIAFKSIRGVVRDANVAYKDIQIAKSQMMEAANRLSHCNEILNAAQHEYGFDVSVQSFDDTDAFNHCYKKYGVTDPKADESDGIKEDLSTLP